MLPFNQARRPLVPTAAIEPDPVRSTMMLLAHQGGWDEILLVLVPIIVVAWLLWLAKRRVSRAVAAAPPADPVEDDS